MEYIAYHYPDLNIKTILDYADITIYQVNDGGHWFNQNQVDRFHEILVKLTENPDIAMEVGRFSPFSKASGAMTRLCDWFHYTERRHTRFMGKMYPQVSRSCLIETRSLRINQAEITVRLKPGVEEKPYQCANRWGTV